MNNILYRSKSDNPDYGMILLHGRGADAEDIIGLADTVNSDNFLIAAPQAEGNTWYPYSFLAPIQQNEPYLSESLDIIRKIFSEFENKKISADKIILAGFSQGACLALEYALRNPKRYGGIAAFSGGIISTSLEDNHEDYAKTPVFLGCSERDPHIPKERVELSEIIFNSKGANVIKKIYPGSFHGIIEDELQELTNMVKKLS